MLKNELFLFVGVFCYYATFLRLRRECHMQNLLEQTQIAPILINIGCNLICLVLDQLKLLTYLGGGRMSLGCFQKLPKKRWGSHVLRVLSHIEFCALAPDFFIFNFRLPHATGPIANFTMMTKTNVLGCVHKLGTTS
jgi:hypothetical protein